MKIINTDHITNNKPNVDIYKFFEKSKNCKTSPKSIRKSPIALRPPMRRSIRLKSEISIDVFTRNLPDGEYDITKEDFDSSKFEFEPLKKKAKLLNDANNEIRETSDSTVPLLDNTTGKKYLTKQCSEKKIGIQKFPDTPKNEKESENLKSEVNLPKKRRQRKRAESSNQLNESSDDVHLNAIETKESSIRNDKNLAKNNNLSQKASERARKESSCVHEQSEVEKDMQPKKAGKTPKCLNNSKAGTINKNGIMKYFNEQDKQSKEDAKSPENNKKVLQSSKRLLSSSSNDVNLQVSQINKKSTTTASKIPNTRSGKATNSNKNNSQSPKQRVCKVNLDSKSKQNKFKKIRKLTKKEIKNVPTRKIPKDRLIEVLDIIDNDEHAFWKDRNISCNPYIYLHWETRVSSVSNQNMKLKFARQFLLRRDWVNLSRVLLASNLGAKGYFPLLSKYASLLMAHTDKEKFDKFVQLLTQLTDSNSVMKKCTKI